MKTLEEAASDYAESIDDNDYTIETESAFKAGYSFSKQWIDIKDEKPKYYRPVIVEGNMVVWRAWSESFDDIYTINGTDVVLKEKPKRWRLI